MTREWRFERTSVVAAGADAVWARVVTPEGINDELRPWLTMSVPRGAGDLSIDTVRPGEPVGRCPVRLFGVLPIDHDDLTVAALEPGRRFREESTMRSMRRWVHERVVEPAAQGGATVTDRITFVPRAPLMWAGPALRVVFAALFAHRHRRLTGHFAATGR